MKTGARVFYIHENFLQKGGAGPHPDRGKVKRARTQKNPRGNEAAGKLPPVEPARIFCGEDPAELTPRGADTLGTVRGK